MNAEYIQAQIEVAEAQKVLAIKQGALQKLGAKFQSKNWDDQAAGFDAQIEKLKPLLKAALAKEAEAVE